VLCTLLLSIAPLSATQLDSLVVEGVVVNQPAVVRASVGLKSGEEFSSSDVQDAIKNLYRLGLFRSVDIFAVNETDSSVTLVVKVEEFPLLESSEFVGNRKLKSRELEEQITLGVNRVLTDQALNKSVEAIEQYYHSKGYLLAQVKTELQPSSVPGNALLKFKISEGDKLHVKEVRFKGNVAIPERKLSREFGTKINKWWRSGDYDEERFATHKDSLLLFYQDKGYLDAAITKDSVWFGENKRDIFIELTLDEGKLYYAGNVYFTGNQVVADTTLQGKVALRPTKPFQKSKYDMTRYLVEDAYREEGFLWVQVRDRKSFRADTIDVTFDITEGRAAVVQHIDIQGNAKTREKVIRRELALLPAQKYRQSKMARSVREIMQLNYFDNATPDLRPNDDGTIDLVFDVDEKDNVGQLSVGAAFSGRDGFVGTFSTSIPNFRGMGQELGLNVEYGKNRQDYSLSFKEPWAFDRPISLLGSVYYNKTDYINYGTTESYGFALGAGTRLKWPDDYYRAEGSYRWSKEDEYRSSDTSSDGTIVVPGEGFMSRLSLTLLRNDTDLPMFPTKGSIFTLNPQFAGLGGDYKYLKAMVGYDHYLPLFWKVVLSTKTKFGVVAPFPGAKNIAISRTELLDAGGVLSEGMLRGYSDYTFGAPNHIDNATTMFTLNTSLQFPILEQQLYLSVFADIGNTWGDIASIDPMDTYKGVGAGIRLVVPMLGLMGFDFGWKLDDPNLPPGSDSSNLKKRYEIHFLMNQGF
jgi:outer membrane protein insertion porin family